MQRVLHCIQLFLQILNLAICSLSSAAYRLEDKVATTVHEVLVDATEEG
jgi:hypothetical protein